MLIVSGDRSDIGIGGDQRPIEYVLEKNAKIQAALCFLEISTLASDYGPITHTFSVNSDEIAKDAGVMLKMKDTTPIICTNENDTEEEKSKL